LQRQVRQCPVGAILQIKARAYQAALRVAYNAKAKGMWHLRLAARDRRSEPP